MTQKTPAQLGSTTSVNDSDLICLYPSGGPMVAITATNFRANYGDVLSLLLDGSTTMTGAAKMYAGLEGSPGITFSGDTDTGIYRVGANEIGFSAAGQNRFDISSTALTAMNGAVFVGNLTGNVTGNISGAITATTISASGAVTLSSTLAVTGAITASSTLTVTGAATFNGNVTLGDASGDTITVTGTMTAAEVVTFSKGGNVTPAAAPATNAMGYLGAPQLTKSADYTLTMAESGYEIAFTATGKTCTIPANGSVAYPIGTVMQASISTGTLTVAITTDTLRWIPTNATGSRTVTAPGFLVMKKYSPTEWWCWGLNVT